MPTTATTGIRNPELELHEHREHRACGGRLGPAAGEPVEAASRTRVPTESTWPHTAESKIVPGLKR
jgi:hypothetical protein